MQPLPTPSRFDSDFLALRYRSDLHLLVGRWQRAVTAAELRQGYRTMLRAAQQTGCRFWQIDLRGRNTTDAATLHWLTADFLPQVGSQVGGPVCLAYLLSPSQLRQPKYPIEGSVRVAFFAEEGPLTAWLTQCQHRSQAALAAAGFTPPPAA